MFMFLEQPFDVVFTDYLGLGGIKDADIFGAYKCHIRILDSFGTDPLCMFVCLLANYWASVVAQVYTIYICILCGSIKMLCILLTVHFTNVW